MENKEQLKTVESHSWDYSLENEAWIAPVVDIFETDDNYVLVASMPGVSKENMKIKMENGNLVLLGRVDYDEISNRNYILQESNLGNYYRKFKVSNSIDEGKIEASSENGLVKIKLPKHDRIKPKVIEIK